MALRFQRHGYFRNQWRRWLFPGRTWQSSALHVGNSDAARVDPLGKAGEANVVALVANKNLLRQAAVFKRELLAVNRNSLECFDESAKQKMASDNILKKINHNLLQDMGNTFDVEHLRSCVQENRHTVFSIDHQVNFAGTDVCTTVFTDFDARSRAFELHSDVDAVEINGDRVASKVALVVLAVNVQLSGGSTQLDSV